MRYEVVPYGYASDWALLYDGVLLGVYEFESLAWEALGQLVQQGLYGVELQ